ncbi:MAG: hypothetical protein E6Q73_14400 [Pseudorhodobacter sp.]|nr:MAG: hypothetical protein E6Q73_14400 [Pseudorhodobacter sp.]
MTFQPRFDFQPSCKVQSLGSGHAASSLTALEEELALMDCVIPLTRIPDLADLDSDEDLTGLNLFSPVMEAAADPEANFLRRPARSPQARGRVVALRRRAMRAQLKRPLPQWPLPGGQADDDLRNMRDQIYSDSASEQAAQPSVPLRVATHAISLSLVAAALPVGAAVMTYNLLKGEDMRVTARLTTLTGLALVVLAGNPQLAQMIGA